MKSLRCSILAVLLGLSAARCGQPAPVENGQGRGTTTIEGAVPEGWSIEQRHDADFNGDSRADALLLLRSSAPDGQTPPRMLVVALAAGTPGTYTVDATNSELVPHDPSGNRQDPLADGGIEIGQRGFELTLGMLSGAGSYQAATLRYRFRREDGCFRLIHYLRAETDRATLATRDLSVDFLTGEVVETAGNAQTAAAGDARRTRLEANPRHCLSDLPSGWTFDPLNP